MTAMVNWYRALLRDMPESRSLAVKTRMPTRILWGAKDAFLLRKMAAESLAWCDSGELFEFPETTHWIQHEGPSRVNQLLIEFFKN
jgi:epoxide hydrolase 4